MRFLNSKFPLCTYSETGRSNNQHALLWLSCNAIGKKFYINWQIFASWLQLKISLGHQKNNEDNHPFTPLSWNIHWRTYKWNSSRNSYRKISVCKSSRYVLGLCRVGNCSSHEPPEPLTFKSGRVILGFYFRANQVN